ncbi:hypothetical protein KPATCC21470_1159 [Kitasatospora purpeofusca]
MTMSATYTPGPTTGLQPRRPARRPARRPGSARTSTSTPGRRQRPPPDTGTRIREERGRTSATRARRTARGVRRWPVGEVR